MVKKIAAACLSFVVLLCGCQLQEGDYILHLEGKATLEQQARETQSGTMSNEVNKTMTEPQESSLPDNKTEQNSSEVSNAVKEESQSTVAQKKALFRESDGTIHGSQIGWTELGSPLYDYDINEEDIPEEWREFNYPSGTRAYLSPSGIQLYKDADGTIHGPQIGWTELGSPLYDYDIDTEQIPPEWR